MQARPCPRCGASLRFRNRYPIMATQRRSAQPATRGDRLGYFAVWLCEREHCGYSIIASNAPPSGVLDHVEATPDSAGAWRAHLPDWNLIIQTRANALIQGPSEALGQTMAGLGPYLRTPHYTASARNWSLPDAIAGTLFLEHLAESTFEQQNILHDWFGRPGRQVQAITITDRSLFDAIKGGAFLSALYYRLNTIHLKLESS
jgi:hypothetical protein